MKEYIDKAEVVAEIERLQNDEFLCDSYDMATGFQSALRMVQEFINTLEVKEVDLEKEIDDYINEHFSECGDGVLISDANSTELTLLDVMPMARHFFELGLKTGNENKL